VGLVAAWWAVRDSRIGQCYSSCQAWRCTGGGVSVMGHEYTCSCSSISCVPRALRLVCFSGTTFAMTLHARHITRMANTSLFPLNGIILDVGVQVLLTCTLSRSEMESERAWHRPLEQMTSMLSTSLAPSSPLQRRHQHTSSNRPPSTSDHRWQRSASWAPSRPESQARTGEKSKHTLHTSSRATCQALSSSGARMSLVLVLQVYRRDVVIIDTLSVTRSIKANLMAYP